MTRVADLLPEAFAELLPEGLTGRRANWIEVARADFADARRSWILLALGGVFAVLVLLAGATHVVLYPKPSEVPFGWGLGSINGFVIRWFVPLAALVTGALAVASEREAGSLRILLGLPITRREIVVGKLLGRVVVFSATLLIGLALAGVESWYFYHGFDLDAYAIFVAGPLLLGWLFVGIGVGFSALFRSRARALGASTSVFALVVLVWHVIPDGVFYLVNGRYPENVSPFWEPPGWFVFLGNVNPIDGIDSIVREWIPETTQLGTLEYRGDAIESAGPFYLQPEFLLVVLLLWAVVPLLIGTWRFRRSDFG